MVRPNVSAVKADYDDVLNRLTLKVGEAQALAQRGKELQTFVIECAESVTISDGAALILQSVAEQQQLSIKKRLEDIITFGLQLVFGDAFVAFSFEVAAERGTVTMKPRVSFMVGNAVVSSDVLSAHGGGPADVIGFLMKLVIVLLRRPQSRAVLFLDEPFAHLSEEYLPRVGELINKMIDLTGLQIIMVTHQPEFVEWADTAYSFTKTGGATVVRELRAE